MVVADTNIFIAYIRGNEMAQQLLHRLTPTTVVSVVTMMELAAGATNAEKKATVERIVASREVLPLDKVIGKVALGLVERYNSAHHRLKMPDALIAATCLRYALPLLTFNTDDFKFIKGLQLAG